MKTVKTNAMRLLDKAHITYQVHEYPHGDEAVDGENVAKLLNEDVSCVFKTLITQANTKEYLVWMVPAAAQLDLKKAAAAAGVKHVEMIPVRGDHQSERLCARRLFAAGNEKELPHLYRCQRSFTGSYLFQRREDRSADRDRTGRSDRSVTDHRSRHHAPLT